MGNNLTGVGNLLLILAVLVLPPYLYHKFRAKKFDPYANKRGLSFAGEKFSIPLDNVGQFFITGNRDVFQRWYRNVIYGSGVEHNTLYLSIVTGLAINPEDMVLYQSRR